MCKYPLVQSKWYCVTVMGVTVMGGYETVNPAGITCNCVVFMCRDSRVNIHIDASERMECSRSER